MMIRVGLLAALLCLAASLPSPVSRIQNINNHNRIPGEYLVVLKQANDVSRVASKMHAVSKDINVVNTFSALKAPIMHIKVASEEIAAALLNLPEVESVEADVFEMKLEQCSTQNSGISLWGLSRVSSKEMPDMSTGQYSYNSNDGAGVRVYVLDTGIRVTHNDFGGRAEWGANMAGGSNTDVQGHGTHCAGTIAGQTYGGSKGTTVVAVKVLSDYGFGSTAWIVNGINWAIGDAASKGVPGVLSMSLGGGASSALDAAVNSAVASGYTTVVAAGNSNRDACNYSPARASDVVTVGATDLLDTLSSYSNWGSCVDILAPGSNILSAFPSSDDGSRVLSGTSMACPLVASEAANYLSQNPTASPAMVKAHLQGTASQDFIDLRGTTTATPNLLLHAVC